MSTLPNTFISYRGKDDGYVVYVRAEFVGARKTYPEALELRNEESLKRAQAEALVNWNSDEVR